MSKNTNKHSPASESPKPTRRTFLGTLAAIPAAFHLGSVVKGEQEPRFVPAVPPPSDPSDNDWDDDEESSSDSFSSSESSSAYGSHWCYGGSISRYR